MTTGRSEIAAAVGVAGGLGGGAPEVDVGEAGGLPCAEGAAAGAPEVDDGEAGGLLCAEGAAAGAPEVDVAEGAAATASGTPRRSAIRSGSGARMNDQSVHSHLSFKSRPWSPPATAATSELSLSHWYWTEVCSERRSSAWARWPRAPEIGAW